MVQKSHVDQETRKKDGINENDGDDGKIGKDVVPFYKLLSCADKWDWILMCLGSLGSVVHGSAQPVGYLLLGKALDAFGDNINDTRAMVTALYKVVPYVWYMAIATFPAGVLEIGCWMYSSERQLARLRIAYLKSVLSQEIGAFDTDLTSAKIISGISNHMNVIQDAIGEKLGHFLSNLATFFSGVIIAGVCSWQVALLTLLVVPMIFIIGAVYTNKMNKISASKIIYQSQATSAVEQTISQIKTVYAFVGESIAIRSFTEYMDKQFHLSEREALIKGVGTGMFQAVSFCSWAFIIWVGAILVTHKDAKGGDILAAIMCILFGAISLTHAAPDLQIFNQAKAAGSEVFRVIQRRPLISQNSQGLKLVQVKGDIELRDVYFSYPSRPEKEILHGFSLSIPAGKTLALVGTSGCGKSTIISLVSRFYDPLKGEVFIDGHNIKDLDLKCLRRNIGLVSQEPSLFSGTIQDNIKVGDMDADDQMVHSSAEMANAYSFISKFPKQYSTEVGERGVQLSGGQKQRIAIARAILKNPPILLLDEATSALDTESERLVQDALERAIQGRTVIVIAHRLSTIVNADTIAVIQNGQVKEIGTHRSLLDTSEFYSNLCNTQHLMNTRSTSKDHETTHIRISSENDIEEEEKKVIETKTEFKETLKQEDSKRSIFFRLWFGLRNRELFKLAIGSIAAGLSGISKPFFGFFIITIGVAYYHPHSIRKVGFYSLIFTVIGIVTLFTHTLQHYFFGIVGEKAMSNLRRALYSGVLCNEIAWFEKPENNVGSLTSRIIVDTTTVKTIISNQMSVIVQCISSILIATIVSMVVDWRMALVAWAVMPCHFIGGLIQAKSAKGFSGDLLSKQAGLVSLASESVRNIRTIASFCHEEVILKKAELGQQNLKKKSFVQSIKYGLIQGVSLCLWNIAHAVALWYTTVLVDRGQSSFKDGIRSYQIFSLTVPSITELWTLIPTVVSAVTVLGPTFETLDRKILIEPNSPEVSELETVKGKIEFRSVKFHYPLRPEVNVLNNFDLKIEPGSRIALVGPSGAGKSSILALLLRFYDPAEGRVMIDDKDIREYNLRFLRTQIGLVQQEPLLFSSSIRSNISYGNNSASEAEILEASMKAKVHEFVSNLPNGYDTLVGENGCQLSGGQKQRVAIARAFLKNPAILLLDEATSALDSESEKLIASALEEIRATRITVAHRISTVVNSDTTVVMDRGEIVEIGPHSSLIDSDGVYSRLFQLQNSAGN